MKIRLILKSFNKKLINSTLLEFKNILNQSNCTINSIISLPIKIKKFCVLRSPHIDKNSREHFELRIYKKFIDLELNSFISINNLLNFKFSTGVSCIIKII